MGEVMCAGMADLSASPLLMLSPEARADSLGTLDPATLRRLAGYAQ